MKIRHASHAAAAVALAAVCVAAGIYGLSHRRRADCDRQLREVRRLVRDAFNLNLLTCDWLRRPSQRADQQWVRLHAHMLREIRAVVPGDAAGREALQLARELLEVTDDVFAELRGVSDSGSATAGELQRRYAAQLMTSTHALHAAGLRVQAGLERRAEAWRTAETCAAIGSLTLLALTVAAMALWVNGRVVRTLDRFCRDTEIIGRGNLDHEITVTARNELGDLARAFNAMLRNLRRITASRDELDREMRQREQAEARLTQTLRDLERSNAELEQFAYAASHDLQEPLRKILAFGSRLQELSDPALGAEGRDSLGRMLNAAQRMQTLINDLLALSRMSARQQPFARVSLGRVARDVLIDLEAAITAAGAVVRVETLPDIDADPTQMRQLLQNLIGNAVKFRRPGIPPEVTVSARPTEDGTACELTVADNGIGLDEKYSDRIFRPFQRLHAHTEYEGSGVGLAICARIAERHHGRINVESAPGAGARFRVVLPFRQAGEAAGEGAKVSAS